MVDIALGLLGGFFKSDRDSVCFSTDGSSVLLNQDIRVVVNKLLRPFSVGGSVTLPALTAGTDYAVYACSDGTLQASANFSSPDGYTSDTATQIGGFHYAPGGNAAAQAGGGTTPIINPYSLWDLKWRPSSPDPRGMALVAGSFWADIYLCGTDVDANGTSRYGVTIADASSPPKIPIMFGGDGSTTYGSFTWFEAGELLKSQGKALLDYAEFAAAAYGTTEKVSRGSDPVTTGFGTTNTGSSNSDEVFTSKWGLIQASGCMWIWGRDLSFRIDGVDVAELTASSWKDETDNRGCLYTQSANGIAVARLGASWSDGENAGSRASHWYSQPWTTSINIGARGRCDHLCHV